MLVCNKCVLAQNTTVRYLNNKAYDDMTHAQFDLQADEEQRHKKYKTSIKDNLKYNSIIVAKAS